MAIFSQAYSIVQRHEGGYVNDSDDTGGETYRGIARKVWPGWKGWKLIDVWKINLGLTEARSPRTNEYVSENYDFSEQIDQAVEEFYQERWQASRAGQIIDQQVANAYFDLYILSSKAVLTLQKSLNALGADIAEDNIIGPQTIGAVNNANPEQLLTAFTDARKQFHYDMVNQGIVNGKYLEGWLNRAEVFMPTFFDIPELNQATGIFIFGGLALGTYLYYKVNKKSK